MDEIEREAEKYASIGYMLSFVEIHRDYIRADFEHSNVVISVEISDDRNCVDTYGYDKRSRHPELSAERIASCSAIPAWVFHEIAAFMRNYDDVAHLEAICDGDYIHFRDFSVCPELRGAEAGRENLYRAMEEKLIKKNFVYDPDVVLL